MNRVDWLNYHHLLYFWTVAREGSIASAAEQLHLSQPTISSQIRKLEQSLGEKLFQRSGRGLELTEDGRRVYEYADEIFTLGRELVDVVKGRPVGKPQRLVVGVPDVLPKMIAYRLIEPAFAMSEEIRLVCLEGKLSELLAELSLQRLDLVLSDAPVTPQMHVKAYNHRLGECGVTFFGTPELTSKYKRKFPKSLDDAPVLMPTRANALRRSLDQWLDTRGIHPRITGEFDDSALLKVFGQAGMGVFPAPTAIETEIKRQYGVRVVGRLEDVREQFYAVSVERRLKHPAVVEITNEARSRLFDES
ncbi:MAG: transcriptional activator NhaR [Planctomycetota bacterium]